MSTLFNVRSIFLVFSIWGIFFPKSFSFAQNLKPIPVDSTKNNQIHNVSIKGCLRGTVKDITGNPIFNANVKILNTNIGDATDLAGNFIFFDLPYGEYKIVASYVGYKSDPVDVKIIGGNYTTINITLKPYSFMIGGIEVIGNRELLPNSLSTQTTITAGEIEHFQAMSLKDVLNLVPGIQKSENPNLDQNSIVSLRSNELNRTSSFGTLIIVDNVPVSNNANLQFEDNYDVSTTGISNLGGGIDLRTIPADNIESIEVITGLPSVKYGDMNEGIIKVKTKSGKQPNRIKFKSNPGTREANFGGGLLINSTSLNYNFNAARSERDRRIDGDEYTRFTAQTIFSSNFLDDRLNLNLKLNGQKIFDDIAPQGDLMRVKRYDKGYSLGFSSWGKMNFIENNSSLEYKAFVNLRNVNSHKEHLVIADIRVLPNGDTVSNYLGKIENRGKEWNLGGQLEYQNKIINKYNVHNLLFGTELRYDVNTGDGLVFDTLFSYYGPESGIRPYSFDNIPGMLNTSFYAEDKISGNFLLNYVIQFGFRYELYRPYKLNFNGLLGSGEFIKSHNGSFFNPRISLLLSLSKNNQIRLSAGKTSKSPALSTLFPRYKVYDWRNPTDGKVIHLQYNLHVPELLGIIENQFEAAYDFSLFNMLGISISAYYKERRNENEGIGFETASGQDIPVFISVTGQNNKPDIIYLGTYNHSENLGWSYMKGIEMKISSVEIKSINMKFQIVGSYSYINASRNGISFFPNPDSSKGQYPNYKVPNQSSDTLIGLVCAPQGNWEKKLQFKYYLTYTHQRLGLWVTLWAQHFPYGSSLKYNLDPVNVNLLNERESILYQKEISISRVKGSYFFNMNITKSLFEGAEVSFYVNNLLYDATNPENLKLFYGIEFSSILDNLF